MRIAENYSLEELREVYPDLARRVESATSVEDLFSAGQEAIERNTAAFFVNKPECNEIFPVLNRTAYRFSTRLLEDAEGSKTISLALWLRDAGPSIEIRDMEQVVHGSSSDNVVDWSAPVQFEFESDRVDATCGRGPIVEDCWISLRRGAADDLYRRLASDSLAKLEVQRRNGPASYSVAPDAAEMIKSAANCIKQ